MIHRRHKEILMSANYAVEIKIDVPVPMRDGVRLSTDLYLPRAQERFPVIVIRTPYSNNADIAL